MPNEHVTSTPASEVQARHYIDQIQQLNRKHGHANRVTTRQYKKAVRHAAAAFSQVQRPAQS